MYAVKTAYYYNLRFYEPASLGLLFGDCWSRISQTGWPCHQPVLTMLAKLQLENMD